MPRTRRAIFGVLVVGLVIGALFLFGPPRSASAKAESPGYHVIKKIVLGGTTGWDYISMDSANRHLFVGRMDYMDVVNVDTGKVAAKLTGMPGVHGILLIPQLNRGFTVNVTKTNHSSTILNLKTLQKIKTIDPGPFPDSYAYDPVTKRAFIMESDAKEGTALNAVTGKVIGQIPLGGQPEFCVADGKGHIFVNITDKNQMLEFDARTLKILHRWSLGPCEGASGLSMDLVNRRLFTACDNEKMVVMNANNGKIVAALPTGAGNDCSIFDPYTHNAFASSGGCGSLTVIHEFSPNDFRVVQTVRTQASARTMALDTKTHDILLVGARYGHGYNHADILPNTFNVMVVGR